MKLIRTFSFFCLLGLSCANSQYSKPTVENGFVEPLFVELPLGSIKPKGWLLNQLVIMRNGTSGHLDEVYSKLKDDNGWLGGKGDAWEETPYWLDGAVPLAYLLNDKELKEKVLKYINWTLNNQHPSGYFGGITKFERETGNKITEENLADGGDDWWPRMIMLKVLQQYYSVSEDKRVINFLTNYFHFQLKTLKNCPIGKWTEWAQSRGSENIMIAQWLYTITKDASLLELAHLIESQSYPWSEWLGSRDWVIDAAAYQNDKNWMRRHGVNVSMGLKSPALNYQRTGDEKYLKYLKTGFSDLMTLHGLPMGIFSADEDLHGNDPTQGAELCAIVESMFSLEQIIGITGDVQYMDALERMTFNALPTQTTDDYNAKQYFQMANQPQVKRGVFNFSLPFDREMNNVFGMRSGYTCCLANMHQGWTKFAQHLWYRTKDNGLAALVFGPNELTAKVGQNNTEIVITENTNYPFEDVINFHFSTKNDVAFVFQVRIPSWCKKAVIKINGQDYSTEKGGNIIKIDRTWKNDDKLSLQLPMEITTSIWGRNTRAIERGPLVYALKLGEKWEKSNDPSEGDYFCVHPKGDWNYGLLENAIKYPEKNITVKQTKPDYNTFVWNLAHAPVELTASAKKIQGWTLCNDVASTPVTDRNGLFRGKVSETIETITLIPYGCTKVRIIAFPVVK